MHIGKAYRRVEDVRFLTGKGRYVDDLRLANAAFAAFLRSPHAHARLRRVDTAPALAIPGVLAAVTARDWRAAGHGSLPLWSPVVSSDGRERQQVTHPVLPQDRVRFVGDLVAMVVAETRALGQDAVEAIAVEYEVLDAITDTARALDPGVPILHDGMESNCFFLREIGDRAAVAAGFASAHHVTSLTLANNRVSANAMEPRAVTAHYEAHADHYTVWSSHQAPHMLRRGMAEHSLRHPEHKIRVIAPDVGGGFGMKVVDHPEDPLIAWGSKLVGRPVRWSATRSESLLADAHGRDHATTCRMALDRDGTILALEVDTIANLGAYQTHRGASIPAYFYGGVLVGLYRTPAIHCRVRGVYTNTSPVHAYRGAGRPEAIFVLERLLENGARELGLDVAAVRLRNLIQAGDFPYRTPVGLTYDSGNPPGLWAKLAEAMPYRSLRDEQRRLRDAGVLMGLGFAAFIDAVGAPSRDAAAMGRKTGGWDSAIVRVHPSAKVTVFAGSHSHGQGHATTFAQIAADRLKCPVEDVEIVEGDTAQIPYGHGTWGSRSTFTSGMAIVKAADRIVEKCRKIAAFVLECAEGDLMHEEARFRIAGTDRQVSFARIAELAYLGAPYPEELELGLENTAFYDPLARSFASAMHMAVVLVDPETGGIRLRDYCAVDDCGTVINPMVLEGQIHGGIAQGAGQALMEHLVYDPATGQLVAGSFMDYAMPRADDLPSITLREQVTPTPHNALGCKGGGESGTIGAPAAVANAVIDALWHLGVRHIEMPMTPERVWAAIRAGGGTPPHVG